MPARLENTRVPTHGFVTGVSRHRREGRVHVLDFPGVVGKDDAIRCLLHSRNETGPLDDGSFVVHSLGDPHFALSAVFGNRRTKDQKNWAAEEPRPPLLAGAKIVPTHYPRPRPWW